MGRAEYAPHPEVMLEKTSRRLHGNERSRAKGATPRPLRMTSETHLDFARGVGRLDGVPRASMEVAMRNTVYFFVFDGYADWEAALALCEIRRPGDFRVRTVALDRRPVQSMGGLTVLPDVALDEIDTDRALLMILPGGTAWERGEIEPVSATL